jgi:hypothetical protein
MSKEETKETTKSGTMSEQTREWVDSAPSGDKVDAKEFDAWRQRGAGLVWDALMARDPEVFNLVSLLWLSNGVNAVNDALAANATAVMESIAEHPSAKGADAWLETDIPDPGSEEFQSWRSAGLALISDLIPDDKPRANAVYQRLNG